MDFCHALVVFFVIISVASSPKELEKCSMRKELAVAALVIQQAKLAVRDGSLGLCCSS